MKIGKVNLINVMDLLHLFKSESDAGHRGVAFQNKASSYLFNVEIILEDVRLSALEVLPFKKFVSHLDQSPHAIQVRLTNGTTYPSVPYEDIMDTFKKQESVNCLVLQGAKSEADGIFHRPLYAIEFILNARISGLSVLNILGVQPYASLPPELLGLGSGDLMNEEEFHQRLEDHINNLIIEKFNEYKQSFFEDDDHFSDAVVYQRFLRFAKHPTEAHEFSYTILNIRHAYGNIQFASSTKEDLEKDLVAYRAAKMNPDNKLRNTQPKYVFAIKSSFKTFLALYMQTDWVKGYENLLLPGMRIAKENIIRNIEDPTARVLVESMTEAYGQNFSFLYNTYRESKKDWRDSVLASSVTDSLSLENIYSIIPANTLISYVIEVTRSNLHYHMLPESTLDYVNIDDFSHMLEFIKQLEKMINLE